MALLALMKNLREEFEARGVLEMSSNALVRDFVAKDFDHPVLQVTSNVLLHLLPMNQSIAPD